MDIFSLLGDKAEDLMSFKCNGIKKEALALPGPDFIDRVFLQSDRNPQVLNNLQRLFGNGRLGSSGNTAFAGGIDLLDYLFIINTAASGKIWTRENGH